MKPGLKFSLAEVVCTVLVSGSILVWIAGALGDFFQLTGIACFYVFAVNFSVFTAMVIARRKLDDREHDVKKILRNIVLGLAYLCTAIFGMMAPIISFLYFVDGYPRTAWPFMISSWLCFAVFVVLHFKVVKK